MKSGSVGEKKQDEKIELKGGQAKEKGKYKMYGLGGRAERSRAEPLGSRHWESKEGQSVAAGGGGREGRRCQAHSGWHTPSSWRRTAVIRAG